MAAFDHIVVRETRPGVDHEARGRRVGKKGRGSPRDFAAGQMFAIGWQIHQAVRLDSVALGRSDSSRERRRLRIRGAVSTQGLGGERLDFSRGQDMLAHFRRPSATLASPVAARLDVAPIKT